MPSSDPCLWHSLFSCSNQSSSSSIMQILWCMYLPPTNSSSGGGGRSRRGSSSTVGHWFSVPHLDCAQPARRIQGRGKLTSWMPIPKPNHWQSGWPGKKVHGVSTRVRKARIRGIRSSCVCLQCYYLVYWIVKLKLGVSVSLELLFATGFVHWTMAVVRGRRDSSSFMFASSTCWRFMGVLSRLENFLFVRIDRCGFDFVHTLSALNVAKFHTKDMFDWLWQFIYLFIFSVLEDHVIHISATLSTCELWNVPFPIPSLLEDRSTDRNFFALIRGLKSIWTSSTRITFLPIGSLLVDGFSNIIDFQFIFEFVKPV